MDLVEAARGGDAAAFEQLVAGHRRELTAHSYRMLGSMYDAEDAVQETLLSAWKAFGGFEGRSSLRTWLYRICTNACLRLSAKRPPRMLSPDHGPAFTQTADLGDVVPGEVWIEPWLDDVDDPLAQRESVELAFVAALQHLPANQRAVLILREVLEYSAAEVADILDTTPASVNSALQRARKTVEERVPPVSQQAEVAALGAAAQRELVEALVSAWHKADVDALLALLTEDAKFTMPPLPAWFEGRANVGAFLTERMFVAPWRVRPIWANGQPALVCYMRNEAGRFALTGVTVLSIRDGRISWLASFIDPAMLARYGLPEEFSD
ncbi:RNA polymerase subunit sigma-70 [Kribbella sp. NBC_01245]|uniref:RNA polymerase subunit sigma-70 n=1 Tax=Kribbella sp. NBC_01245 TaxID=2903578 RepID=UPI002E2DBA28|nr:RNA polymerase subunit sigma-70 [Kribbella sp. NBC_01245]